MNIPAVFILLLLSALLIRGTRESAFVNNLIVITKVVDRAAGDRLRLGVHQPGEPHAVHSAGDDLHDAGRA